MAVIEVYGDIWCPFTHVGLRLIADRRRDRGRTDAPIHVRAWPLELVNGVPLDPIRARDHARELREQVAPDMFRGIPLFTFPATTLPALGLAASAYTTGDEIGERVSFALRHALFEEGLDISDRGVLRDIAGAHGLSEPTDLDRAMVLEEWHEGQRRGVRGSPHFFCGGRDVFCPSLDISRDPDEHLLVTRDLTSLDSFLDICLE